MRHCPTAINLYLRYSIVLCTDFWGNQAAAKLALTARPCWGFVAVTRKIFSGCKPTTGIRMTDVDIRDFFRLEDALPCEYKLISSDQIATADPETLFDYSEEIRLMGQLRVLQRQGKGLLERIELKNAEIAAYLNNLDQQVELIGRRVLFNEIQTPDSFRSKLVDLSVGGAGLCIEELLPEESYVALRVLIDEGTWVLTCFARVRYSRMHEGDSQYRSGIEFVSLSLEYQKLINRYLLNRQTEARRAQIRAEQNDTFL